MERGGAGRQGGRGAEKSPEIEEREEKRERAEMMVEKSAECRVEGAGRWRDYVHNRRMLMRAVIARVDMELTQSARVAAI